MRALFTRLRVLTLGAVFLALATLWTAPVDAECGCRGDAGKCYDIQNPGSGNCLLSGQTLCVSHARLTCGVNQGTLCATWNYTGECSPL
jgi:hypothetical protein